MTGRGSRPARVAGRRREKRRPEGLDDVGPSASGRRSWWREGLSFWAVALVIIGVLVAAAITWFMAPWQEARGQRGVEADHAAHDASVPPLRGEQPKYEEGVVRSSSSSQALSLADVVTTTNGGMPLPGEVEVGQLAGRTDSKGGGPAVFDAYSVTLVGQHYSTVQISNISARTTARRDPVHGTILYGSPQSAVENESMGFDLDSERLSARILDRNSVAMLSTVNYFDRNQVTLTHDERITFTFRAVTSRCSCDFVLDVTTVDGSVTTVDDGGSPWRISAFASKYSRSYAYDLGLNQIVSCAWPQECLRY